MNTPRNIVEGSMVGLVRNIQREASSRGKNASGGTSKSLEVTAVGGEGMAQATLTAEVQWRYWGNGRAPGKMPPIEPIKSWIASRNLTLSAYAVAKGISLRGSLDFQRKNTNIVLSQVGPWETELPGVEQQSAEYMMDRTEQIVLQSGLK